MIDLTLAEIAAATGGVIARGAAETVVSGSVETDSRLISAGSIFFALRGEATDGHLFADAAVAAGAALIIAERQLEVDADQVIVADGVDALQALAREVVARVRAGGNLQVVAVTGSNGKTTTKNMLREVLSAVGETVAPRGSFNNEVGAPISMFGVTATTRFLVVEMGADAIGDITKLSSIVQPDVGIVLKVGMAHIGKFGSPEAVATAKAEMVTDLPATATAVLNLDDPRVRAMAEKTAATIVGYGFDRSAAVRAENVEITVNGTSFTLVVDGHRTPVTLNILGEHHVMNALATIAAARSLGVAVADAVASLEAMTLAERGRMQLTHRADGVVVINDAYNASPDSMAAALKTLAEITRGTRRSFAVLGEMAELGDYAFEEHDRIGRLAVRLNVSQLLVIGQGARHIHNAAGLEGSWDGESLLLETADEAYDVLRDRLHSGDVVLVKASNSVGLQRLGDRLAEVTA